MQYFIKLTASYTANDKNLINLQCSDSEHTVVTFMQPNCSDDLRNFPSFQLDGPSRFITDTPLDYIAVY